MHGLLTKHDKHDQKVSDDTNYEDKNIEHIDYQTKAQIKVDAVLH